MGLLPPLTVNPLLLRALHTVNPLLLLLPPTVSHLLLPLLLMINPLHPQPTLSLHHSAIASPHHHRCHRTHMAPLLPQPKIHTPPPLKTPMGLLKPQSSLPQLQPSTISHLNHLMESKVVPIVLICDWIFIRLFIFG